MRGIWANGTQNITINNFGIIKTNEGNYQNTSGGNDKAVHFMFEASTGKISIQNYKIAISETASEFNSFTNYNSKTNNKNSHLIVWKHSNGNFVEFKDDKSKLLLDVGDGFEFGAMYKIAKLITNQNGNSFNNLSLDYSRLALSDDLKDLYTLTNNGEYFIIQLLNKITETPITAIYKANIRTMNNFYAMSNSMIYPRKYYKSQNLRKSSLRASVRERGNQPQNLAQNNDYYFILTPFINHNYFFESGRYNLRGFDYGFLTAFSGKIAESNTLGTHFMMSYGSLGDSSDKNFHISNLNLNLGLNYKLDLIYGMYLKARGDFFYFLNQVKTLTMMEAIKPNNLGFGLSVSYGKDFDFKQGGVLGIEGGIDYKALSANEITLDSMSETYQKSLYNVLYVDLGMSYAKYFGNFGLNANLGIKGNVSANKLAKSQIRLNNFNRSVDMVLDNDKVLGYANVALSCVLNHRNFDMEFSLAYYGNFGDRIISNGGGFEWRVGW